MDFDTGSDPFGWGGWHTNLGRAEFPIGKAAFQNRPGRCSLPEWSNDPGRISPLDS